MHDLAGNNHVRASREPAAVHPPVQQVRPTASIATVEWTAVITASGRGRPMERVAREDACPVPVREAPGLPAAVENFPSET